METRFPVRPSYSLLLPFYSNVSLRPVISAIAPASRPHFVSNLLKTLPLIGGQDLLQALVGLLANVIDARL
jgi:hypothetical protein